METEQIEKKGNPYVEAQISGEQHGQLEQWLKDEEPIEIATGLDGKVYLINIKGSQKLQKKVARVLAEHHRQGSRGQIIQLLFQKSMTGIVFLLFCIQKILSI